MAQRLEPGERVVVVVTPAPYRLYRAWIVGALLVGAVVVGARHQHLLHHYQLPVAIVVVAPWWLIGLVRLRRWRSQKIVLTTDRLMCRVGLFGRVVSDVDLREIAATQTDQTLTGRLRRRGDVVVETHHGTMMLGPLRHPDAFRRTLDRVRRGDLDDAKSTKFDQGTAPARHSPPPPARRSVVLDTAIWEEPVDPWAK